ncbi:MAG: GreA/GreB family elongation factor [Candidatus Paceibacterota bacterium]
MDKSEIIKKIISELEKRLEPLDEEIKDNHEFAIKAPGAMESHSDTSKFQFSRLAANLQSDYDKISESIKLLKKIDINKKSNRIEEGSIIKIKEGDKILFNILLPSVGGGIIVSDGDIQITSISASSPLGKELIGKKEEDEVEIKLPSGIKSFTILEII